MEICPLAPPPARLYYRFCSDNNKDPSPGCTPVNKRLLLLLSAGSCRCATGYTNNRRFVHYAKKEWPTHNQAKKKQKRKGFRSMAPGTLPCYSPTQKKRIIKRINKTDTNRERNKRTWKTKRSESATHGERNVLLVVVDRVTGSRADRFPFFFTFSLTLSVFSDPVLSSAVSSINYW